MKILLATVATLTLTSPATAQTNMPSMNMPGMTMPAKSTTKLPVKPKKPSAVRAKPKVKPKSARPRPAVSQAASAQPAASPTAQPMNDHDMSAMPGMDMASPNAAATAKPATATPPSSDNAMSSMPGMELGKPEPAGSSDAHAGHDMAGMEGLSPETSEIGTAPAPASPTDHAADALFDPVEMARAREALRKEGGAFNGSMILFNLAEYQTRKGRNGYRWEGEAWFGGDIDRLVIKSEGEGNFNERIGDVEIQALYSRAITPFWNAQIGVRHDIVPNPSRTYAVVGIEGIAPYWFDVSGQLFLSGKGDFLARIEGSYDERITQRLIFQPRAEINFAAQDMPAIGVASGLTDFELGGRLRYEIRKEFAPYIGVEWSKKVGGTARFARLAGEKPGSVNFVTGIRVWF